jgi:hypothetical protein
MAQKDTRANATVKWMDAPEDHDFDAAASYLGLVISEPGVIASIVQELRDAPITYYKVKDLLRASQLPLLAENNKYVAADLAKIKRNVKAISPILLVQGSLGHHPLIIADGYHRVCAIYYLNENTLIPVVSAGSPCLPA